MKRFFVLLLTLSALLMLIACNKDNTDIPATESTELTSNITESTIGSVDNTQNATEPPTAEPPTTEPPTTEPPATEPPATEASSPTRPSANTTGTSFDSLVAQYSGKWYLDGYANVYLDIFTDNDGWLLIYTNNFFLPDIYYGRDDGIVYPFLSGIACEEYCAGATIPPVNDWKQHVAQCRLVFDDNCIYAGSYKFVRNPGSIEKIFCLSHHWDIATCQTPSTCIYCGQTEGNPVECQFIDGICHFCGKKSDEAFTEPTEHPITEPPATDPPTAEPPVTEPPATEPLATEPPVTSPASDVLIINDTRTISDQTINTDVYITSTGVATFNNVTVNGNVHCYGKLTVSGCHINNVYAYYWDMVVATGSCSAWDGTHGLIKGLPGDVGGNVTIKDYALDYAFDKWGKK